MSTEQALAKGTRVDEDKRHEAVLAHLEQASKIVATWPAWKQTLLGGTARMDPPEPTIGQLVDAMQAEIERVCERMDLLEPEIRIDIFPGKKSFVAVRFYEGEELLDNPGCTLEPEPEAALKAMIKRLEQMRKAEK